MAIYAIGDIQGCFKQFKQLLVKIDFNPDKDKLWICGDLVNRGPKSLETLQYIRSLGDAAVCVLGNHDLHLLAVYYGFRKIKKSDTFQSVIDSPDAEEITHWLRQQKLFHFDMTLNCAMVHAGIYPKWNVEQCLSYAQEVEQVLQGDSYLNYFENMYGDEPAFWSEDLSGMGRLRFITNVFTRMRYVNKQGELNLDEKGDPEKNTKSLSQPWFVAAHKRIKHNRVVFGHWSTLPSKKYKKCFALDSGCLWGGQLTALRIDRKKPTWHRVDCD